MNSPGSSKELVTKLRNAYAFGLPEREAYALQATCQQGADEIEKLLEHIVRCQQAAVEKMQSTHEPPADDRPTDEHVARFSNWLAREMPTGTVIGDPGWWARKLLNAAYVYLPGSSSQPPGEDALKAARSELIQWYRWFNVNHTTTPYPVPLDAVRDAIHAEEAALTKGAGE